MAPNFIEFKNILVQLCRDWKVSTRKIFDEFQVEEALEEANANMPGDLDFAANVLWKCCCADGKFNNATVVFLAVVKFLKDRHGDIGSQPFIDLGAMLKQGTTAEAIRKWLATHYA